MLGLVVLIPLGNSDLETDGEAGQRECCWDQRADVITCALINETISCAGGAYIHKLASASSRMQNEACW